MGNQKKIPKNTEIEKLRFWEIVSVFGNIFGEFNIALWMFCSRRYSRGSPAGCLQNGRIGKLE